MLKTYWCRPGDGARVSVLRAFLGYDDDDTLPDIRTALAVKDDMEPDESPFEGYDRERALEALRRVGGTGPEMGDGGPGDDNPFA